MRPGGFNRRRCVCTDRQGPARGWGCPARSPAGRRPGLQVRLGAWCLPGGRRPCRRGVSWSRSGGGGVSLAWAFLRLHHRRGTARFPRRRRRGCSRPVWLTLCVRLSSPACLGLSQSLPDGTWIPFAGSRGGIRGAVRSRQQAPRREDDDVGQGVLVIDGGGTFRGRIYRSCFTIGGRCKQAVPRRLSAEPDGGGSVPSLWQRAKPRMEDVEFVLRHLGLQMTLRQQRRGQGELETRGEGQAGDLGHRCGLHLCRMLTEVADVGGSP